MSIARRDLRPIAAKMFRYGIVGGIAALIEWTTFWAIHYQGGYDYRIAIVAGFLTATLANYLMSIRFVFERRAYSRRVEVGLVYVVSVVALAVNYAVTAAAVDLLGVEPMIAKVAGTGTAFFVNFGLRYVFVFGEHRPAVARR